MTNLNPKELKIIDAAHTLFHRHGFKRVTMHDLAEATGMSRPALYLVYPNKEVIFEAVVRYRGREGLSSVREGLKTRKTVADKLRFAFEFWTVRPFEIIQQSPDARDLIECTHGFARPAMEEITTEFESIIRTILAEITRTRGAHFGTGALARLLVAAAHGFKTSASDSAELRALISHQIVITLAALENVAAHKRGGSL